MPGRTLSACSASRRARIAASRALAARPAWCHRSASWSEAFYRLESHQHLLGIGYPEVGPGGVAEHIRPRARRYWLMLHYRWLIGNGAFAFKARSVLTTAWWNGLNRRMDRLLPSLRLNPACHPRERPGEIRNGEPSAYPVLWSSLLGAVLQPIVYRYRHWVSNLLPAPSLRDYK